VGRSLRILILGDRAADAERLAGELGLAGFSPQWVHARDREQFLAGLQPVPDLVVADNSLSPFDAPAALALLREGGIGAPFFVVTGAQAVDMENHLRQSQKVEALGRMAGGVAHDFNNMLQVIGGYLEVLSWKGAVEESSRPYLEEIRKATERAGRLTQQLLAFSSKQVLELKPVDMNEVVANLLKMIHTAIGEHIRLSFLPGDGLPAVTADTGQLEQVLLNLCLNARDAMPAGGTLTIETCMEEMDRSTLQAYPWTKSGRYVRLSVSDTGCGMDSETRSHLFEPFFTTKDKGKGTGLGLATAYGIVKQHQGLIDVQAEAGKGARFSICLPAREGGSGATGGGMAGAGRTDP